MIIRYGVKIQPRLVSAALAERLRIMPAVVITGARQTGKSTLAEHLLPGERHFRPLDDLDVLDAARRAPEVRVGGRDSKPRIFSCACRPGRSTARTA